MTTSNRLLPPLLRLPPELQLEILKYLTRIDQVIATQVCTAFRLLLSTKAITQTHYLPVPIDGRSPKSADWDPIQFETYHREFPSAHFLLAESKAECVSYMVVFLLEGKEVVRYVNIDSDDADLEGDIWDGKVGSLDEEIRDFLLKEREQRGREDAGSVGPEVPALTAADGLDHGNEEKEPGPGGVLDISLDEDPTAPVIIFVRNSEVSRHVGGQDFADSSSLDEPFLSPFIAVPNARDDSEEMKFQFKLDIYKDDLIEGPAGLYSEKWEEKIAFERSATVRDWIAKLLESIFAQAVRGGGVTEGEKTWGTIQVDRVRDQDAWKVRFGMVRVSDAVRDEMVWVRRTSGRFLLIKKQMWDQRAEWDLSINVESGGMSKGNKGGDGDEEEDDKTSQDDSQMDTLQLWISRHGEQ
ncbi:hypothetical protein TWF718_000230 [Orbilia javanica]|uniref:F-box domain-containing protein n=1 Tax=Orbilia javanica TaxID=47235 RepID=A0AAN8NEN0_9PEZI